MKLANYSLPTVNVEHIVFQRRQFGFWATFTLRTATPGVGYKHTIRPYIEELKAIQKALATGSNYATIDGGYAVQWWTDCIMCQPLQGSDSALVALHCNVLAVVEHMLCSLAQPLYAPFTLERAQIKAQAQATYSAHATVEERNRTI